MGAYLVWWPIKSEDPSCGGAGLEYAPDVEQNSKLRMRTREGIAVAKAKGKLRGKQPKLSARQQAHLVTQHQSGEHTIADLAEIFSL